MRAKARRELRRYVIVGNGVASFAAAEAIRALDPGGEIVILGNDPHGYYSRPGLAYLISDEIPEKSLYPFTPQEDLANGFDRRQAHVERVDPAAHRLFLADGSALVYDRLLLAPGAAAAPLSVPGAGLEGVVKLDHLDDARQILKLARRSKSALVVGGGITALELVEGLVAHGIATHYLLRGERYWNNVLDDTEARIVEHRLEEHGVRLHFKTEITEVLGKNGRVAGVRTAARADGDTHAGEIIACELLAAAIGIQPRLELAQKSGLNHERGILVDEYLQTSAADIFAAGDAAQILDPQSGQYHLDSLWTTARDQGRAAGGIMAGSRQPYHKKTPFNVTRLAGITTTIIGRVGGGKDADLKGIARGDSETWRQAGGQTAVEGSGPDRVRLMVGEKNLLGALVMGRQTLSPVLQELIAARADIMPVRAALLQPGAALTALIEPFWSQWRQAYGTQQS
jgi:NADPH-dependent 2,4-dienoyl-CoA reductase/sulfur reductase-like enzyme